MIRYKVLLFGPPCIGQRSHRGSGVRSLNEVQTESKDNKLWISCHSVRILYEGGIFYHCTACFHFRSAERSVLHLALLITVAYPEISNRGAKDSVPGRPAVIYRKCT